MRLETLNFRQAITTAVELEMEAFGNLELEEVLEALREA
jgi:hypothetical protein